MITINSHSTEADCNRVYMQARREADERKQSLRMIRVAMLIVIVATVLAAAAFVVVLAAGVVR